MTITLITINYNDAQRTIALLRSLEQQTDTRFDVIVVDNDSQPAEREPLGTYAAGSRLALDVIFHDRNEGYAGGNAVGIRKALAQGSDWLLLLNSDTVLPPEYIEQLRKRLHHTEPSLIGLPTREHGTVINAGRVSWLSSTLAHERTLRRTDDANAYIVGAALVIHRTIIDRIGLMDPSYFIYFEDAEYTLRARKAGAPIQFWDGPIAEHAVSATTSRLGSPLLLRYHIRNALRFNMRNAPWVIRCAVPFWMAWVSVKQIAKLCIRRDVPQSAAILAGVVDALRRRWGFINPRRIIAVECESLEDASWGVARQVRGFLEHFVTLPDVQRSYDVIAYFKSRIPDEPWLRYPHVRAVVVRPFPFLPPSFSLYFYVFLPIRIWFDRPAVTLISNYMLPLIFIGRSIVMLTEDVWHEMYGTVLPFRYRAAYRIFATWAAKRATRIMAISHASKSRVAQLFTIDPDRIVVNELAVPAPKQVTPRHGPYVLYVAQGLPRRHLRESILAFRRIAPQHPDLTFIAIGPDKYQPPIIADLVARVNAELGRDAVVWTERVSDDELARTYAGAAVLVYVSDVEAFGLPPLEALTYGVPSILMDAPVHRELLGDHAFYVQDASIDAIAQALETALTDEAARASIRGAAGSVAARYTWDAHARRMLDIIRTIVS